MRQRRITGRVTPPPVTAPQPRSLALRLGGALQLRRANLYQVQDQGLENIRQGGTFTVPKGAKVLSDILANARYLSREPRDHDYLHVSDLIGKCLRKIALAERYDIPLKAQSLSLTDSITFSQGDAIHDVIRVRAAQGNPRMVWGKWKCKCGTTRIDEPCLFSSIPPDLCPSCGEAPHEYVEVSMFNEEYKIVGNPDLVLYLPDAQALYVTELKSIAHDAWKELARPIPDHTIQVLFYWFLMRELGYRLADTVSILYVSKGWMFSGEPYKEFTFNAAAAVSRLQPYLEDALAVKVSRAGGDLPPKICAREDAPDAKKCAVCKTCFGIKNDEAPVTISMSQAFASRAPKPR